MEPEQVGQVLAGGFGDQALIGFINGVLDKVSSSVCYHYIRDNKPLLYWVKDWAKYRKWAKKANIQDTSKETIIASLRKYHPELLGVIQNTPGGMEWFDRQISELREKLGLVEKT